jgi:hypothetical protein
VASEIDGSPPSLRLSLADWRKRIRCSLLADSVEKLFFRHWSKNLSVVEASADSRFEGALAIHEDAHLDHPNDSSANRLRDSVIPGGVTTSAENSTSAEFEFFQRNPP